MNNSKIKTAETLSVPVAVLATIQAGGGLFLAGLYRDGPLIVAAMKGNDVVTLVLVAPLLIWSLLAARRGSLRGRLVWVGCLGYMVYNYLYYLYGIAFNRFFLVYVAVFISSLYGFIYALSGLNTKNIGQSFGNKTPVHWIAGFMILIGSILGIVELSQVLGFVFQGNLPPSIVQFGDLDAPALIFAADLTLVVPAFILGAIWLWQRRNWGYVLSAIMLVKAFTYGLALIGMVLFGWLTIRAWDPLLPFYVFIAMGGFVFLLIFLKNVTPHEL